MAHDPTNKGADPRKKTAEQMAPRNALEKIDTHLLVGQNQNDGITELILAQELRQLQGGLINTLAVI